MTRIQPDGSSRALMRRTGKALASFLQYPGAAFAKDRVVTTRDDFKMWCLHENLIEREIARTGVWEPTETAAVKRLVKPGFVCVDVGANVGYYSLLMAKLGAAVHAFEPTTYGFARFNQNLSLNSDISTAITLHRKGLSDRAGAITEAFEARFSLRVLAHNAPELMHFETLDAQLADKKIDFVKIDVDGHDTAVVRGGYETLRRHRPIVLAEFCDRVLQKCDSSVQKLAQAYEGCGYDECEVLETVTRTSLRRIIDGSVDLPTTCNILLT